MNFVRYEKDRLVIGDENVNRLQKMVDRYRSRGYNVSELLGKLFDKNKDSSTVYYKIISL